MTIRELLIKGKRQLSGKSDTPELDTSVLLAYCLKTTREKLYLEPDMILADSLIHLFMKLLKKRSSGISIAYLTGVKEFFGRNFFVGPGVLSPRPDSETMIETILELGNSFPKTVRVLDLCSGSGCLAITLKSEKPEWLVDASDISPISKHYCRKNSQTLKTDINFHQSDLFSRINSRYNLIISNPPYLTGEETGKKQNSGDNEPGLTLDGGGEDGLNIIRQIIRESVEYLLPGGGLFIEAAPWQLDEIIRLMQSTGFAKTEIYKDLAGRDRIGGGFLI